MEEFVKDFDGEFADMSLGEKLYADALAHLLDTDTKDYIDFLAEDEDSLKAAADSDSTYGED